MRPHRTTIAEVRGPFFRAVALLAALALSAGCISWNYGVEAESPGCWKKKVDTLTPTIRWKPYAEIVANDDLRYELIILDGKNTVFSKGNIRTPFYTLEQALEPNKEYEWHVRPVWTEKGKTVTGPWNYQRFFVFGVYIFYIGARNCSFFTPEKI